jgi:hypothetical protein
MKASIKNKMVIELNNDEIEKFLNGLGSQSVNSRIESGMSREQSEFFSELFLLINELYNKED